MFDTTAYRLIADNLYHKQSYFGNIPEKYIAKGLYDGDIENLESSIQASPKNPINAVQ
jgi:hypothetical protein